MMLRDRTVPAFTDMADASKGFSLVELMVGMTIAMIMFLVISNVFVNFENQKRVTSLSSDTQSSGIMAIFELEQAIRSAGAGIVSEDSFDCLPANTKSYYTKAGPPATTTSPVPGYGQFFAPVVITSGAGNGSDTLEVRVGAPVSNAAPTELAAPILKAGPTPEEIEVKRGTGFPVGSVLMVVNDSIPACAVMEVTSIPDPAQPNRMSIAPAASGNTWNPTVTYRTTNAWPDFGKNGSYVYAPGAAGGMNFRTYTVNASGQLQVVNSKAETASSTDMLVGDVVSFQAQYGVSSAAGVQDIQKWVEPVLGGTYETNWDPGSLDANKVKRIKAIRLVIVLRSPKLEPANVTSTCTSANGAVNNGPCAWEEAVGGDAAPLINLSADANWRKYRYRVFQTIIPLRNTISAGV